MLGPPYKKTMNEAMRHAEGWLDDTICGIFVQAQRGCCSPQCSSTGLYATPDHWLQEETQETQQERQWRETCFIPKERAERYLHRGAFEPALADEDQEQDSDRWCSHSACVKECLQIVSKSGLESAPRVGLSPES